MPVIREIHLDLKAEEVIRQSGINKDSRLMPKVRLLIDELLRRVEKDHLLEPVFAYEVTPVTKWLDDGLHVGDSLMLNGSFIASTLEKASDLAVVFCTIGSRIEEAVAQLRSEKHLLKASLLDGLGSAAVDLLTVEAYHRLKDIFAEQGLSVSGPINPGARDFPISDQHIMAQLVPIEKIGLELTVSAMMRPQKSISMIIGVGSEMPSWTRAEACARCNLAKSCRYRLQTNTY
jgi:hypothetical protein